MANRSAVSRLRIALMNDNESIVAVLNELLSKESQSVLPRLAEAGSNVSWSSADEGIAVGRMIEECANHSDWLVSAIRKIGGEPRPMLADIGSTHLHYLELTFLLPHALEDCARNITAYQEAQPLVANNRIAGDVVSQVLEQHRQHKKQLASLTEQHKQTTG